MKKNRHILVFRLSAMGDVAMSVPVLQRLLAQHPELNITVVTRAFFVPMFADIPRLNTYVADVKGKHKGFWGLWKLAKELRALKPDAIADLHNVLRTKIIRFFCWFWGIKQHAIDKGRAEKKALTQLKKKQIRPLQTTHQRYAKVFKDLGYPVELTQQLPVRSYSAPQKVHQLLGNSSKKWMGIAPFAAHQSKMYPLDLMEQVIASLNQENAYELLLFGGGKTETQILQNLASKYKNATCIVGELSFAEELQLIANLDGMLSMDSGNGHLAALFDIPVISLWGATHPFAGFAPFQQAPENQLMADREQYPFLPTSVYGNKRVPGYEDAMRSISVEKVVNRVKSILQ